MKKFVLFIIFISSLFPSPSSFLQAATLSDMKMGITLDDIPESRDTGRDQARLAGIFTGDVFKDSPENLQLRINLAGIAQHFKVVVSSGKDVHLLQALIDLYRKILRNGGNNVSNTTFETTHRNWTGYADQIYASELDVIMEKGTRYEGLDQKLRNSFLTAENKADFADHGYTQIPNWTLYMAALFAIHHELVTTPNAEPTRIDYVKMTILRHLHRIIGDTDQKGFSYVLLTESHSKFGEKPFRDFNVGLKITDTALFLKTFEGISAQLAPLIFGNTKYKNSDALKKDLSAFLQNSYNLMLDLAFQPASALPENYADQFIANLPGVSYIETTPPVTQAVVVNPPAPQAPAPAVDYAQLIANYARYKTDADQKQAAATTAGNTAKANLYAKASLAWQNAADSANKADQTNKTLQQLSKSSDQQLFMNTRSELDTHNANMAAFVQEAVQAQTTAATTIAAPKPNPTNTAIEVDADATNKNGFITRTQLDLLVDSMINKISDPLFTKAWKDQINKIGVLPFPDWVGSPTMPSKNLEPSTLIFPILSSYLVRVGKTTTLERKKLEGMVKAFLWAGFGKNMADSGVAEDSTKPSGLKITDPTKFFTIAAGYFAQMMHELYPAKPFETHIPKGFNLLIVQYHNLLSQQLADGATQLPLLIQLCKLYEEYVPTFLGRPLNWENMATIFGAGSTDIVNIYNMLNEAYGENSEPVKRATLLGNLAYRIPFKDFKYMPNPTFTDLIQNLILAEQKYRPENFVNNIADFLGYYFMPNLQFVKGYDDNAQMQHTQEQYVTVAYDPAITLLADLLKGIEGLDANLKSQIAGLSQKVLMTNPNITNLNKMRGAVVQSNAQKEAAAMAAGQAQLQAQQQAATAQLQARGKATDAANRAQNEAEIRAPSDPVRNRQKGRQGKNRYNKN